ncbi:MAG TPA: choice-of-anchor Q domain-containing protein [Dokdonella sp.]
MRTPDRSSFTPAFVKAPLAIGLALILGSSAAWSAATPALGAGLWPAAASGLRSRAQRAALAGAPQRTAGAAVVSNCDDSGAGSLRDALTHAVSGDVIDLTTLACSSITLTTGALTIAADDLTLNGPGAGQLAIDAGNASRIIEHSSYYGTLTIDGLTLQHGTYVYAGPNLYSGLAPGACVLSNASVTVVNSTIEDCNASGKAVSGGAIRSLGKLYLIESTVSNVTATATASDISATIYGGAIYAKAAYIYGSTVSNATIAASSTTAFSGVLGGGIFGSYGVALKDSTVTGVNVTVVAAKDAYAKGGGVGTPGTIIMSNSTVSNNSVHGTPGAGASGAYIYTSAIGGAGVYVMSVPRGLPPQSTIDNSTISGNSAICDGEPGQYTVGGGAGAASWSPLPLTITNSTFSGNRTNLDGGALYTRHLGSITLANSTLTDNTARNGGGIADKDGEAPYGIVTHSSIVAGNHQTDTANPVDIFTAHTITGANNLIASANATLPGDTLGGEPLLGPLADNGGPTMTHVLLAGSPAIDAGSNLASLDTDQRGDGYVRVFGTAADIGAFESQGAPDLIFADGFD